MQMIRRHKLFRLWLVGTLIFLMGTGLILRPDRAATQYLKHQHAWIDESYIEAHQLVTIIRALQSEGLTLDQIKSRVLSKGLLTDKVSTQIAELKSALSEKDHAQERLALFATVALFPPLILLELGAVFFWARRARRVCPEFLRMLGPAL